MKPDGHPRRRARRELRRRRHRSGEVGRVKHDPVVERPSFRQGFGFGGLSVLAGAVLGIGSSIAIARLYGIEVIGQFALVSAPTGLVWFLSTVREKPGLVRKLAALPPRAPMVSGLFLATLAFSFGLTAVVSAIGAVVTYFVFRGPIGQPGLFLPAVVSLAGYLVITNTCWNYDTVFGAFRAGRQLFWIRLNQSLMYLVFAVGASFVAGTVWSLVWAQIASTAVSLVHRVISGRDWMSLRVHLSELREGFRELPGILWFGLKTTPGSLAGGITVEAGTWILGVVSSVATVGVWNRVWLLGKRLLDLNVRLTEMLLPTLVERLHSGDRTGFERALIDSLRYVWVGMLLPASVAGGASTGVMALFGPGFSRGAGALTLMLLVPAMMAGLALQTQALYALDRPLLTSALAAVQMIVTLATSIPMAITLGVTGVALGLVCGCVAQFAMQAVILQRQMVSPLRSLIPYRNLAVIALAYGAGFFVARTLDSAVPGPGGLLVALAMGSVAYAACIVVGGGVLPRDRERLASVTRSVRDRRLVPADPISP
jgi:O-antigen/teichoic acid export membrane protein